MRFLNRLFCFIFAAIACGSCVESVTLSYDEIEAIALEEWIKINRPELMNNYQPNGGYYVELLDEGVADSVPVRYHNAWLWFDVTCRDLAGNVVLTRNSELARMQDSYTDHTHYVPYFLFCGEENSSKLPEGTYMSMRNKLNYKAPDKKLNSYQIDSQKCIKCGACMATCKFKAIVQK